MEADIDFAGLAKSLLEAVGSGNYALVAVLAVVLIVFLLRKYGGGLFPVLAHPKIAVVLAVLASVVGAIATAMIGGQPLTLALVLQGVLVALGAMGAWSGSKEILKRRAEGAGAAALAASPPPGVQGIIDVEGLK